MRILPGLYIDHKDCFHNVVGVSENTEDGSRMVIYQALHHGLNSPLSHIPLTHFLGWVDADKHHTPAYRFRLLREFAEVFIMGISPSAGLYRHFKGNIYNVIGVASTSTGANCMMVYQPLGGPHPLRLSHRPLTMFSDSVDRPEHNYKGLRFKCMQTYMPRLETERSLLARKEPHL